MLAFEINSDAPGESLDYPARTSPALTSPNHDADRQLQVIVELPANHLGPG